MLLSIVTGTYNRLDLLQQMVASVRRSLYCGLPYEFIIVDGGSNDGTIEWCNLQSDVVLVAHGELRGAILNAYAQTGAAQINGVTWVYPDGTKAVVRWNMASPRAEEYARQIGTGLITNTTADMRDAVRNVIADGYAYGRKWDAIARDIVGRE